MSLASIIDMLTAFSGPSVFNPWRDTDPQDIADNAPGDRIRRLLHHFDCMPRVLLVGEAPGYQGCHFSGIPFTNEALLLTGVIPRVQFQVGERITSRRRPWCEPSATIVWRQLHALGIADSSILWNAFAWHPHAPDNPYSNRTPTKAEQDRGLDVLRAIVDHFDGVGVVAVGRTSQRSLARIGIASTPVQHPAYGGASKFRDGLAEFVTTTERGIDDGKKDTASKDHGCSEARDRGAADGRGSEAAVA